MIIGADRVLARQIALESFQAVAGRNGELLKRPHAVELIRFGFYGKFGAVDPNTGFDPTHLLVVCGCTTAFLLAAIYAYNPSKGLIGRRGGPGGGGG